ncbi:hypothetical protein [Sulfolobus sp. B1]|uniref:hypothetical protein n=1 Tax=Sulfolobus sp. B1 TaxID=2200888 RepID=UPI00163D866D|nr:hypothetical protein [Sulfolobus sp. B1]
MNDEDSLSVKNSWKNSKAFVTLIAIKNIRGSQLITRMKIRPRRLKTKKGKR